ncbi:MAG: ATP-binding cassette domain-containing protein [Spirochaetia bacterium]|nr:ATP-binding cassette domain-containing protein [Spirochaetia bacterium]
MNRKRTTSKQSGRTRRDTAVSARPRSGRVVLALRDGRIAYGKKTILSGAELEIHEGGAYLLVGPNGSGKTSLMRTILGLLPLAGGKLESDFRRVGYVPQQKTVDRQFPVTIRACLNMSFTGFKYMVSARAREERYRAVTEALRMVGLEHKAEQRLSQSSGGEIQRTLFARALVLKPDFLVMDEPTASLDVQGKAEILAVLRDLVEKHSMTLLMTSHDSIDHASFITSEIRIDAGRIIKEDR